MDSISKDCFMDAGLADFILWGIKTIFHLFQKKMKTTSFLLSPLEKVANYKGYCGGNLSKTNLLFWCF